MLLESLHVLDGPVDTVKEWQKISAQMVNSASSLRGAEPVSKTIMTGAVGLPASVCHLSMVLVESK